MNSLKYYLKLKDRDILTFYIDIEFLYNTKFYEVRMGEILDKTLLPIGFTDIKGWIKERKTSKNRLFMRDMFDELETHPSPVSFIDTSYGLSLNDAYWVVPEEKKDYRWEDYNLYDNEFSELIQDMSFIQKQASIKGEHISPEFTTKGALRKCWNRTKDGVYLCKGEDTIYKRGSKENYSEYYCYQVSKIFFENSNLKIIPYDLDMFKGKIVSTCKLFCGEYIGYVSMYRLLVDRGVDVRGSKNRILNNVAEIYGIENIEDLLVFDSMIGNTDRHLGNYGMLFCTNTNELIEPAPVFDNGMSFLKHMELEHITDKDFLLKYNHKLGNCFDISFEGTVNFCIRPRHKKALEQLTEFKLTRHPKYNLDVEWTKAFEQRIRVNAINFLKELKKTVTTSVIKNNGVVYTPKNIINLMLDEFSIIQT